MVDQLSSEVENFGQRPDYIPVDVNRLSILSKLRTRPMSCIRALITRRLTTNCLSRKRTPVALPEALSSGQKGMELGPRRYHTV